MCWVEQDPSGSVRKFSTQSVTASPGLSVYENNFNFIFI